MRDFSIDADVDIGSRGVHEAMVSDLSRSFAWMIDGLDVIHWREYGGTRDYSSSIVYHLDLGKYRCRHVPLLVLWYAHASVQFHGLSSTTLACGQAWRPTGKDNGRLGRHYFLPS